MHSDKVVNASIGSPGEETGVLGYDRVLLAEAHRSAVRSREGLKERRPDLEAGGAAAAILLAAAACEAWMSEFLAYEAIHYAPHHMTAEDIEAIRTERDVGEQWKRLLLRGTPPFTPGTSSEYQDLLCLRNLRNAIAHRNARLTRAGSWPNDLDDCVRQRRIPVRRAEGADWTSVVFVHEVAEWAARVASQWLQLASTHLEPIIRKALLDKLKPLPPGTSEF